MMKSIDVELEVGDRVWVQEYDVFGEPLRLRFAEILGIVRFTKKPFEIMVNYLDGKREDKCVSLEHIKEYCKKESY